MTCPHPEDMSGTFLSKLPIAHDNEEKESISILPNDGIEKISSTEEEMDLTKAYWVMHICITIPLPPSLIQQKISSPQQHNNDGIHHGGSIK